MAESSSEFAIGTMEVHLLDSGSVSVCAPYLEALPGTEATDDEVRDALVSIYARFGDVLERLSR
jgi:hypothetical protein